MVVPGQSANFGLLTGTLEWVTKLSLGDSTGKFM
jgi:hypothetical protein